MKVKWNKKPNCPKLGFFSLSFYVIWDVFLNFKGEHGIMLRRPLKILSLKMQYNVGVIY